MNRQETPLWLSEIKSKVALELADFFQRKRSQAALLSEPATELVDSVAKLTLRGGKRIRSAILHAGYVATDTRTEPERTTKAACALELLQTFLLIHDDWMDQDDERRGGTTVHVQFGSQYQDGHLGASLAILAGDLACAYAWELITEAPFPAARFAPGLRAFADTQQEVVFGQQLDLIGSRDVDRMQHLKTGSYTVRAPLRLGALLANGSADQLELLEQVGKPMGLAFQLKDDLLGTFGDRSTLGKPTGNDLRAGKRTALLAEADKLLSSAQRSLLATVVGVRNATDEQIAEATELLTTSGARTRVETRLKELVSEARAALRSPLVSSQGRAMLLEILDMLVVREV